MLHKLAQAAAWLDAHDLFAESNLVTGVFLRVATDMGQDFEGEEPEVEITPAMEWAAPTYHNQTRVHAADADFLEMMQQHNPDGHAAWVEQLARKRFDQKKPTFDPNFGLPTSEHTHSLWLGGREIRVPVGFSNMTSEQVAQFFLTKQQQDANSKLFKDRLNTVTRGGKARSTFELNYLSSSPTKAAEGEEMEEVWRPKSYTYDPKALARLGEHWEELKAAAEAEGKDFKTKDPRTLPAPLFDTKQLSQLFNSADMSNDAERERLKEKSLGTRLKYPFRGLLPEKVFGLKGVPRYNDPLTGLQRPNFYVPRKDLRGK